MIVIVRKVICCGIEQWGLGSVDGVAAEVLTDPGLGLVYELGRICDKVRSVAQAGEYILRTSAHMDRELSRSGLEDSRVKEVSLFCVRKWFTAGAMTQIRLTRQIAIIRINP
jgi:hypothetical protein